MSKIKLSDDVAKRLKEFGVNHIFMVSGGGAMFLNDSLGRVFSYTACHHEQACAIAAEGYARIALTEFLENGQTLFRFFIFRGKLNVEQCLITVKFQPDSLVTKKLI